MINKIKLLTSTAVLTLLSACGGGGSSEPIPVISTADFDVSSALKNYYLVAFSKNVNLTSQNANNLTGTGTITRSVIPNSIANWYNFGPQDCGFKSFTFSKVVDSAAIRLSDGQSFAYTSTHHIDGNAIPYRYDDLYLVSYLTPPKAAKVNAGSFLFSATESPKFFVTFPGTCAPTTSNRDITVNWMLDADTSSTAILKITEIEVTKYDGTSTSYTYLKIQPNGTILSRRYEERSSTDQIVLFYE